jgi:superfamily I DNA and/or RNA helicase
MWGCKVLLIGDYKQLPPYSRVRASQGKHGALSILKVVIELGTNRGIIVKLKNIYRFNRGIFDCIIEPIYEDVVFKGSETAAKIRELEWVVNGVPVVLIDNTDRDIKLKMGSRVNPGQRELVRAIWDKLRAVGSLEVMALTPYTGMAESLSEVGAVTTEKSQGGEVDAVIYSVTKRGITGEDFVLLEERLVTTLTRAKELVVIVGNLGRMEQNSPLLRKIFTRVRAIGGR